MADPDNAVDVIAQHLRRFWDPRMRKQILAHVEQGGEGMAPEAKAAVARLVMNQTSV